MNKIFSIYIFIAYSIGGVTLLYGGGREIPDIFSISSVKTTMDTIPLKDRSGPFTTEQGKNPFDLEDPKSVDKHVEYDPETGLYKVTEKIGNDYFRAPTYLSFEEYMAFKSRQQDRDYYKNLAGISASKKNKYSLLDPISKVDIKRNLADRLFGGLGIEIKPQGSIEVMVGANYSFQDIPELPVRLKRQIQPDFRMPIQIDVQGSIGDKLNLNTNFNSQASFDFENKLKLEYDSEKFSEDDIIKKIEAGNVSLPLRSNLIQGSQNLFGFKTDWQFGHLRLTGLVSQQKSKQEKIQIKGGGVVQEYEIRPDQFDENRHFFLSHFHRNNYEPALSKLPEINSSIRIKAIEVWMTDDSYNTNDLNVRDIVALADIGATSENNFENVENRNPQSLFPGKKTAYDKTGRIPLPTNSANQLYDLILDTLLQNRGLNEVVKHLTDPTKLNLQQGRDFEKVRARKLTTNEFIYNEDLGFISLRTRPRPNQVVAVSYQYTYNGKEKDLRNDVIYKVGEFSSEIKSDSNNYQVIYTKLIKSSNQRTDLPSWKLMMKNVYSTGGYNLNKDDFTFDLYYDDKDAKQKRYIEELDGFPLLNLFRLDFLNKTSDPQPDGVFDFVPGQTVVPTSGSVIFPVLEPFGKSMKFLLDSNFPNDPQKVNEVYEKYNYSELYDTSITIARRNLTANQFVMRGSYKSGKSNEINLRTGNLNPNSKVTVRAGSRTLNEGTDYIVDRNQGKVTLLNEADLQSGVPIDVGFEDQSLFSFQTRTMLGFRAEYSKRKDFYIGGTYMQLFERPFTQKVNLGEDPINNKIFGIDLGLTKQAPWMTRALDKIPFYSTKEPSKWALQAEGALLKPGHSGAINQKGSDGGVIYIDDFEGSSTGIGLAYNVTQWLLASTPSEEIDPAFRGSATFDNLFTSSNRALLSWYRIDEAARSGSPDNGHSYSRLIDELEIFPNKNRPVGFSSELTFDLSYYPREKGPYNYDELDGIPLPGSPNIKTAGITADNELKNPNTRWAGIMTRLSTNDFELSNVEYIDFWMLNPFMPKYDGSPITNSGKMYFQLGTFSEDIFKDSKQQFENGLSTTSQKQATTTSVFGTISQVPPIVNNFDIKDRAQQDLGFDGLNSKADFEKTENTFFKDYLSKLQNDLSPQAYSKVQADPSNDDYVSYRATQFNNTTTTLQKYKRFNMPEGNAQIEAGNNLSTAYSGTPDQEDLITDRSLNQLESYYNYTINLNKTANNQVDFDKSKIDNFITDTVITKNNEIWYRFRIPILRYDKKIGSIADFRSIQSMRIMMTGFDESVTFRMIKFQLGRNTWRRFNDTTCFTDAGFNTKPLVIDKVDIEENSQKAPFNYVLPVGIQREKFFSTQYAETEQNETSLLLKKDIIAGNCEESVYKITELDLRRYKRIKMFVHAETATGNHIKKGEIELFFKLGKDFTNNYYEYSIPLQFSEEVSDAYKLADSIWLKGNEIDFPLTLLTDLKNKRNFSGDPSILFTQQDPEKSGNLVKVLGNPTLANIRGIQVGFRNKTIEDKGPVEFWINELRLTGLDERGGYALQAKAEMNLADLGNISIAGNYNSLGWGGLDQRIDQRALSTTQQFDANLKLELSKFLPKKSRLRVPFNAIYSNTLLTPEFDPIDTDIKLKDKLAQASSAAQKDSIKERAVDKVTIRSIAFNNVRIEKGSKKAMPWSPSNFGLSYSRTITKKSNPIIQEDNLNSQQGSLDYNYTLATIYIEPFKKIVKSEYLKFISDFNFSLLPSSVSVRNNLERKYSARSYRFAAPKYSRWEDVKFGWLRDYSLNWDFTRSLKFNFSATNDAAVDEITYNPLRANYIKPTTGEISQRSEVNKYRQENLMKFGRTKDYKHNFVLSYNVPTRLIPMMDWVTARAQYSGNYNWAAGSINVIDSLGSTISNGQNINLSGEFNLLSLYNKSKFLRKINGDAGSSRFRPTPRKAIDPNAKKPEEGKTAVKSKDKKTNKAKNSDNAEVNTAVKLLLRPLMSVRRISANYTENRTTVIPGYGEDSKVLGMSSNFSAPGWQFISGMQPSFKQGGFLDQAGAKNWITKDLCFAKEMVQRNTTNFGAKAKIEPFKDFNIDVNLDRNFVKDHTEAFKYDSIFGQSGQVGFQHFTPFDNGRLTVSYISLQTLFSNDLEGLFNQMASNRSRISKRVGSQYNYTNLNPDDPRYVDGFNGEHIEVVAPSFLAAYTNKNVDKVKLDILDVIPLPNWQLNYSGLTKLKWFKERFQDISLRHGYKNTLTVNEYKTNLNYKENQNNQPIQRKETGEHASYYSKYEIPSVVINESFSPLLGINIKTKNGIELGLDMGKMRRLSLENSLDGLLLETKNTNYTVKLGYIIRDLYLPFIPGIEKLQKIPTKKINKKKKKLSKDNAPADQFVNKPKGNDLNITVDFGFRDDISYEYELDKIEGNRITSGSRQYTVSPQATYSVNKNLNVRLFVDYRKTIPYVSNAYKDVRINGGLTVQFLLN
jgi:cell surface protein SprA